jgi:hypothetical protein
VAEMACNNHGIGDVQQVARSRPSFRFLNSHGIRNAGRLIPIPYVLQLHWKKACPSFLSSFRSGNCHIKYWQVGINWSCLKLHKEVFRQPVLTSHLFRSTTNR